MLTADAYLFAGMVAPEAALASRGTQIIASGTQTCWRGSRFGVDGL